MLAGLAAGNVVVVIVIVVMVVVMGRAWRGPGGESGRELSIAGLDEYALSHGWRPLREGPVGGRGCAGR